MGYYDISKVPDEWCISSNTERHISLVYFEGDDRSVGIVPKSNPEYDRWVVKGYAGYDGYPVFGRNLSVSEAIETAINVAKKTVNGESPNRVETNPSEDIDINTTDENPDESNGGERSNPDGDSDGDSQADLSNFIG